MGHQNAGKVKGKKPTKKHCTDCVIRQAARDEVGHLLAAARNNPMHMMGPNQPWMVSDSGFSPNEWATWGDNYPAVVTRGQWRSHTQTSGSILKSSEENGRKIDSTSTAMMGEIQETQKAIKMTNDNVRAAVQAVEGNIKTVIDSAHASTKKTHDAIKEAQAAIKSTQDTIQTNHATHSTKQGLLEAEVAKVWQFLEKDAKKREEAQRMEEMQEAILTQAMIQAQQLERDREFRGRLSRGSTRTASSSSSSSRRRRHAEAEMERQRESFREGLAHDRRNFEFDLHVQQENQRLREEKQRTRWRQRNPAPYYQSYSSPEAFSYDDYEAPFWDEQHTVYDSGMREEVRPRHIHRPGARHGGFRHG
ncbi:hypothetical protein GGR57DRAFT_514766 [Xylariaceae sp. FL1272]|nr:hypothetical protein GGR57DRAFT_514766 [Xylariaceae sp. FL1272]